MFDEKDENLIEGEINSKSAKKDEDVEINIISSKGNFDRKFNSLQVKYKKDKKKYIVAMSGVFVMLSMVIGSSYAYLTMTSKTNNSVTINAGTLALTFQNETNTLNITNAVPMNDEHGLAQDEEYSFEVKNNGDIPASYKITLDNICQAGNGVDTCIPDQWIKVGLKEGNNDYKVLERDDKDEYVIETGTLAKQGSESYKMKLWLDYDTPNDYNSAGGKTIVYKGKLGLAYSQGEANLVDAINTNNYTVTHNNNTTTSEIKNDGSFDNLTNQPYIRINGNSSNVDTSWYIRNNSAFNVTAGNQYVLSFYVRSENASVTQYMDYRENSDENMTAIMWSDGTKSKLSAIKTFDNDGQWHEITETFTAPEGVTSATINIGNDTPDLFGEGSYIDIANIKFLDK